MTSISQLIVYPLREREVSQSVKQGSQTPVASPSSNTAKPATASLFRFAEEVARLVFDRHFVIVNDTATGRFETQRSEPRLALIETHLPQEVLSGKQEELSGISLTLKAPDCPTLQIPLVPEMPGSLRSAKVWEWSGQGLDQGDEAAHYLSQYLNKSVRLIRYAGKSSSTTDSSATKRPVDESWAEDAEVAFSDGFPLLLTNEASLEDLNAHLAASGALQIPMNRFRPNIVTRGSPAWQEDAWAQFRVGSVEFHSVKPCDRCKVTTTDQATAAVAKDKEPLRTLGHIRAGRTLGWDATKPAWKNSVFMGWNLVPKTAGVIKVGDLLEIVKARAAPPEPLI